MSQQQLKTFIQNEIKLNPERYEKLKGKFEEIKLYIQGMGFGENKVVKHGSIATKTAIKPVEEDHEYDLDMAIVFERELSDTQFKEIKNKLYNNLLTKYQHRVEFRAKCINIKFSNEFNVDIVIMSDTSSGQTIYNTEENERIDSDNLDWIEYMNDAFATVSNDVFRDTAMLIKFFWRQYERTEGLIPSIGVNALVVSNCASKLLDYKECMLTTLSNVQNRLNQFDTSTDIQIPFKGGQINTNIKSDKDIESLVRVIDIIKAQIQADRIDQIPYRAKLPMGIASSSSMTKPWQKTK